MDNPQKAKYSITITFETAKPLPATGMEALQSAVSDFGAHWVKALDAENATMEINENFKIG